MNNCPICKGHGISLGVMGVLFWLRCRQCGLDFSIHASMAGELDEDFSDAETEEE